FVADPGGFARLRVDMRQVRDVDRQFLFDDATGIAHAGRLMPPGNVDALHDRAPLAWEDAQDLALLTLVAAADHDDVVVPLDFQLHHFTGLQLEDLRRERDDLHEAARPQFAGYRPE